MDPPSCMECGSLFIVLTHRGAEIKRSSPHKNKSVASQRAKVEKVGGNCSKAHFRSIIAKRQNHLTIRNAQNRNGAHSHVVGGSVH